MPDYYPQNQKQSLFSVYDMITQKFIEALEKEVIPWRRTWTTGLPKNLISKKEYQGINILLLGLFGLDEYYLTFNQIVLLGGSVKRGEKSIPIVYWKLNQIKKIDQATGDEQTKTVPLLRYFRVFGVSQTVGLENFIPAKFNNQHIIGCDQLIDHLNPTTEFGIYPAYSPKSDTIKIPRIEDFSSSEEYYSTLYHEVGHWTGHSSRLNRKLDEPQPFSHEEYSKEELIAELTASFLCSHTGIHNTRIIRNQTAYIQSWMKVFEKDKKILISAGSKAKEATEYILRRISEAEEKKKQDLAASA